MNGYIQLEDCEILDMFANMPTLALQEKTSLEGEITLSEASSTLKNMKNNKKPWLGRFYC